MEAEEEEVESLKRKTGEIDFIERSQGTGILGRKTKNLCVACLLRTEAVKWSGKSIILYSSSAATAWFDACFN